MTLEYDQSLTTTPHLLAQRDYRAAPVGSPEEAVAFDALLEVILTETLNRPMWHNKEN